MCFDLVVMVFVITSDVVMYPGLMLHGRMSAASTSSQAFQIFVKTIEGKTITMLVEPSMQISKLMELIAERMNACRSKARLSHSSYTLNDNMRISDYDNIQSGSTLFEDGRLKGGGPKVIKSIVKSKYVDKVSATDEKLFAGAFQAATTISSSSSFNVVEAINSMSIEELRPLKEYMANRVGNTTNMKMMTKMHEFLGFFRDLTSVQAKLNSTLEHFKELVQADLDEHFTDDNGKVLMDKMKETISNALAIKTTAAAAANDMT